jgi:predicted HTH domain antitoxin
MELKLDIPDQVAEELSANGDLARVALEALALEGYREENLTLVQVSELLGLSRVQTEDFLGRHGVSLARITESDLDREGEILKVF